MVRKQPRNLRRRPNNLILSSSLSSFKLGQVRVDNLQQMNTNEAEAAT